MSQKPECCYPAANLWLTLCPACPPLWPLQSLLPALHQRPVPTPPLQQWSGAARGDPDHGPSPTMPSWWAGSSPSQRRKGQSCDHSLRLPLPLLSSPPTLTVALLLMVTVKNIVMATVLRMTTGDDPCPPSKEWNSSPHLALTTGRTLTACPR